MQFFKSVWSVLDDLLANVPAQFRNHVDFIIENVYKYISVRMDVFNKYWDDVKHINDNKEFALYVIKNIPKEWHGYLFAKRKGNNISMLCTNSGKYVKYQQILDFLKDVDA